MRNIHHGNDAAGDEYAGSFGEELTYVWYVMEHVSQEERLYRLVRERQSAAVDNKIGHTGTTSELIIPGRNSLM